MNQRGLARRHRVNRDIVTAWIAVAGEELAGHTAVRGLRRGTLTIEVDSGPLCHELAAFRSQELLVALRERLRRADVQSLRFRVGSLA